MSARDWAVARSVCSRASARSGKLTVQDVLPDGTIAARRTLLRARVVHQSSTARGDHIAIVAQAITAKQSTIYVIERVGPRWRRPVRLAHGGAAHWPWGAQIDMNSRGQVAVAFNVQRARPPLAELGVRAIVSP
jgi:hypothetical protein